LADLQRALASRDIGAVIAAIRGIASEYAPGEHLADVVAGEASAMDSALDQWRA
jgi:hypothetical protein